MTIDAVFDGKTFVPIGPVSLPPQTPVRVVVRDANEKTQAEIDAEIRAYYANGPDEEDIEWAKFASTQLKHAWDDEEKA